MPACSVVQPYVPCAGVWLHAQYLFSEAGIYNILASTLWYLQRSTDLDSPCWRVYSLFFTGSSSCTEHQIRFSHRSRERECRSRTGGGDVPRARRSQLYSHACSGHRIEEARQSLVISIGRPDRIASHRIAAVRKGRTAGHGARTEPISAQSIGKPRASFKVLLASCRIHVHGYRNVHAAVVAGQLMQTTLFFFKYPGLFIYIRDTIDSFGHKRLNDAGR